MEFLQLFTFDGLIAVFVNSVKKSTFHKPEDVFDVPTNTDVYFGPAMRSKEGNEKEDVLGTQVLWVDADSPERPQPTFPPTAMVFSGHGWHIYWKLKEPCLDREQIEVLNKYLIADIPTADKACWNVNRILRVPGTTNKKEPEAHVPVVLKTFTPNVLYNIEDFFVLATLDNKVKHKIRTGDSRGYASRSDRDWAIITTLIMANASDMLINTIFKSQPCGDKARENEHYLPHTISRAREKFSSRTEEQAHTPTQVNGRGKGEVVEGLDGLYIDGKRKISTFTLDPTVLLDGAVFGSPDAVVCNVHVDDFVWNDVTFSRGAFTSVSKFDKEAPAAAWQFLGSDRDIRLVLPYLMEKLKDMGLPRVAATETLGLHKIKDQWLFLGDTQTLGASSLWSGHTGPLCWLPTQKEHPKINLSPEFDISQLAVLRELVPKLNEPETVWPMIGWYSVTCLKPWIEEQRYRFPIMNVTGTKGSGKTSLIQRVFMPLFGQTDPKTFDSGTTRFVTLALMGSSNAIPLAFSEFRYELVERFIRFILLAYDTGHDPRGRGDQTTVDYPLSAPFTVDGEDLIADPAAQERMVVAQLHPGSISEGTEAYEVFEKLETMMPPNFGGYYVQSVLQMMPGLEVLLKEAKDEMFTVFPKKMPDRVRNNHIVVYFGIKLWCAITGTEVPSPEVLRRSISSVYDIEAGRARTFADTMIEDVVNAVVQGTAIFNNIYDAVGNTLWIQLAPAHSWWITSRRRQGRGALERDAIRQQLKEAPYIGSPQVMNDAWMFPINLEGACASGLDIPTRISEGVYVVRL